MQAWRNWQTRTVQVRVKAISWKFESSCLHQKPKSDKIQVLVFSFFYLFSFHLAGLASKVITLQKIILGVE
jgi:hypothetical protein